MTMQFTWQGCDAILASPLVLDLARLTLLAQRRGEVRSVATPGMLLQKSDRGDGARFPPTVEHTARVC